MILIIGKDGQLGTAFASLLGARAQILGIDELDLLEADRIATKLNSFEPELVINCAAHTQVDLAESEEDKAFALNAVAVGELARWTARHSVPFVTYSTDYVFDGTKSTPYTESDLPHPLNTYGVSKLAGEEFALEANPATLIVRTSWLLSGTHPNFLSAVIAQARRGPLRVVDDQVGVPNIATDIAAATLEAVDKQISGLLHLSSNDETTWYGLARAGLERGDFDPDLVHTATTAEYVGAALRPVYGVLASERATGITVIDIVMIGGGVGIVIGVLGSFTTFSTFGYETVELARHGAWTPALANVALNLGVGLAAVVAGRVAVLRLLD